MVGVQLVLLGWGPAAPCSASSPPATFEHGSVPKLCGVLTESIRCQVADLQSGEQAQELLERHPGRWQVTNIILYVGSPVNHKKSPTRTPNPPFYTAAHPSLQSWWSSTLWNWEYITWSFIQSPYGVTLVKCVFCHHYVGVNFLNMMGLINETLVNLQTDLHIKAYSTKNLLRIQEHVKLYSGNSDLLVNKCVDHNAKPL